MMIQRFYSKVKEVLESLSLSLELARIDIIIVMMTLRFRKDPVDPFVARIATRKHC